jgi:hypothetical protein
MLGTAFPASRLLLVEQPGPWGRAGLLDSRFDRAVAHRLIGRLSRAGVRVLAIRRPGRTGVGGRRRWAVVDCRPDRECLVWGQFGDDAELLQLDVLGILGAAGSGTVTDAEPVFAVCAHGTHDVCCAIRGRPVAAALDRARPGQVWECSHVGGDRFAANVLVLPSGMLYGRVVASSAEALVEAVDRGGVLDQHVRGRAGFAPDVQAAMGMAYREQPHLTVFDVRVVTSRQITPLHSVVRLRVAGELVEVDVRAEKASSQWITCQAAEPAQVTVFEAGSLRRVEGDPDGTAQLGSVQIS